MSNTLLNAIQVQGIEISDNHLPAMAYTNLNTSYKLDMFGHNEELFFNVQNLFNTDPPVSPNIPTNFNPQPVQNVFERLGRLYTVGVRVKW